MSETIDTHSVYSESFRIGSIFIILAASLAGVFPPVLAALRVETMRGMAFSCAKAFGAGIIITTAFVHILPESMEDLASAQGTEEHAAEEEGHEEGHGHAFPVGGAITLASLLFMFFLELLATEYFNNSHAHKGIVEQAHGHGHGHSHGHSHGGAMSKDDVALSAVALAGKTDSDEAASDEETGNKDTANSGASAGVCDVRTDGLHTEHGVGHDHVHVPVQILTGESFDSVQAMVVAHMLELGIVIHSVTIGINLGLLSEKSQVNPLLAALVFHQFFEGIGLGSAIAMARISRLRAFVFCMLFAVTTPIGIAIGIGIDSSYDSESTRAFWVRGVLNAVSAGLLIYVALVNMLVPDFSRPDLKRNNRQRLAMAFCVLLGYGAMTLIGKWA